jgi:hypothetical protein
MFLDPKRGGRKLIYFGHGKEKLRKEIINYLAELMTRK